MKILVLTKRQYNNKDLLLDKFGRIRELTLGLARHNHQVIGLCLSYQPHAEETIVDTCDATKTSVEWRSLNAGGLKPLGALRFLIKGIKLARDFQPDVVLSFSDSIYGILGLVIARCVGCKFVFDLFDNFEAFASAKIPGVLKLYRYAVRKADLVFCVSGRLTEYVSTKYGRTNPTITLVNGVSRELFRPMEMLECRKALGLPVNARIIGSAGALSHSRGIEMLLIAFQKLAEKHGDLHLALAGPVGKGVSLPAHHRLHYLGHLPHHQVPTFINSLDCGLICAQESPQIQFSFPGKAYEMLACGKPIVCADIGPMQDVLKDFPKCLFQPDDSVALAAVVLAQLSNPTKVTLKIPTWEELTAKMEDALQKLFMRAESLMDSR